MAAAAPTAPAPDTTRDDTATAPAACDDPICVFGGGNSITDIVCTPCIVTNPAFWDLT
jgi:hypothetical protein